METELLKSQDGKAGVTNVLLTLLVTLVSGIALQNGAHGLLWFIAMAATLYGLVALGLMVGIFVTAALAYIAKAVVTYANTNAEATRMQILNDVYNKVKNK